MHEDKHLGDAAERPGLSAPEGASIPIAGLSAITIKAACEAGFRTHFNLVLVTGENCNYDITTELEAFAQAVAKRCAEIASAHQDLSQLQGVEITAAILREFGIEGSAREERQA